MSNLADTPPVAVSAPPRRRDPLSTIARIVACAIAFRLLTAALGLLTNLVFPEFQPEQFTMFGDTSPFWDPFTRYDSGWYMGIARTGYQYAAGGRSNIAFFPVYPLLMRAVGRSMGTHIAQLYLGGIIVSWVNFTVAMVMLYKLARLDLPRLRAEKAVLLAAIFPFAFFFGVVYTESTFLLFTVAAFYGFRTRHWVLGGICGGIAAATRVNGIMAFPALALLAWQVAGTDKRQRAWAALGLLLVASGLGAYSFYVYQLSGNPLEWAATIQRWGYYPGGQPWKPLVHLVQMLVTHPYVYLATERMAPYDALNGLTALTFTAAIPFVWRRLGAAYALFMMANLWLPLSSGVFEGMGRYCAVMFPCFIWLASIRSRTLSAAVIVLSALFYTLCLALFTNIHPIF